VHEFFAIVTHPRVHRPPSSRAEALQQIEAWMKSPSLVLLAESDRYWTYLSEIVKAGMVVGGKIHDARIAAICRQHGVRELWSADRDFSRFGGLKVVNPLLA
jgi:predicted nucleic acid-binding protein